MNPSSGPDETPRGVSPRDGRSFLRSDDVDTDFKDVRSPTNNGVGLGKDCAEPQSNVIKSLMA